MSPFLLVIRLRRRGITAFLSYEVHVTTCPIVDDINSQVIRFNITFIT